MGTDGLGERTALMGAQAPLPVSKAGPSPVEETLNTAGQSGGEITYATNAAVELRPRATSRASGWDSVDGTGRLRLVFKAFIVFSILNMLALGGVTAYYLYDRKWGSSQIGIWTSRWCCAFATIFTAFQIHLHLTTYTNPQQQQKIIRILLVVPVYSITSMLALQYYKEAAQYLNLVRNCYESFTLFTFFQLLLDYLGGSSQAAKRIRQSGKETLPHPPPLCCLSPIVIRKRILVIWQCCIMQYVYVQPLCALVAIICKAKKIYNEDDMFNYTHNAYPWLLLFENISVTIAFTSLFYFYLSCKETLAEQNPTGKFIAIKIVVFLCFWQGCVISLFVKTGVIHSDKKGWSTEQVATGLQDYLVCIEMLLITFLHKGAFSHVPYLPESGKREGAVRIQNVAHAVIDVRDVHEHSKGFWSQFFAWVSYKLGCAAEYDICTTPPTSRSPSVCATPVLSAAEAPAEAEAVAASEGAHAASSSGEEAASAAAAAAAAAATAAGKES